MYHNLLVVAHEARREMESVFSPSSQGFFRGTMGVRPSLLMRTGDIGEVVGFGEVMGKGQGRVRSWKGDGACGGVLNSGGGSGPVVVEGGFGEG
jgi:hypothetical protein